MPLEGIFLEPSSKPVPDLSLHISPPNCDSSSRISNGRSEVVSSFDLSTNSKPKSGNSFTELSLAHPANDEIELRKSFNGGRAHQEEQPQNPYLHIHQSNSQLNQINHGDSLFDASDGLRPIKGIPVYPNRPFPFLSLDHSSREKDPRMRFYQMSYPSWSSSTFSSSSVPHHSNSPFLTGGLDHHMPLLNLEPNASSSTAAYRSGGGGGRFNGISSGYQLHHHHNHQYGMGPSNEASHHGIMRSRFLPKLPAKRSMRAPRMRWTSTLHSRFVHAVELLGGHESKTHWNLSLFLFFSIFFWLILVYFPSCFSPLYSCLPLSFFVQMLKVLKFLFWDF
ncbi:hypothetical protein Pfo_018864 [Paulownia fortunei]|nr:hypothetical protein Pfo_018864 [Paulownia fortunei]